MEAQPPDGNFAIRLPKHRIERRAVTWWALRETLFWIPALAALTAIALVWEAARAWLVAPLIVAIILSIARCLIQPLWRYRVHRWEIADHATFATSGWLVREWRVAPTSRVQTVDAVRGPLEQLFGLATLRVTTASSHGAISIVGLDLKTATEAVTHLTAIAELTEGDAT